MLDHDKTKDQLLAELTELRQRLAVLESTEGKRQQTEDALRASEERFRTLAEFTYDWGYWRGPDGKFLYVTPSCQRITGYSPDEFMFDPGLLERVVHPEDRDRMSRHFCQEQPPSGPFKAEFRIVSQAGEERWIEHICQPVYGVEQRWLGQRASNRDITDRKRAEKAFRESQRRLATLLSNLPGIAYRCKNDPDWTVEFISEGCFRLTGYHPEDLLGNRTVSYGNLIHADDRQMVWDKVQEALLTGQHFQSEYRIQTAQGQWKWVWEQGVGVFSDDGRLEALEGFITDISGRKQAEEALQEAHEKLEETAKQRTAELAIFRRFAEASGQGFGMADIDGYITYLNPALCRAAGVAKPTDAIGKHLTTFYPEDYRVRRQKEVIPALLRDGHWEGEIVFSLEGKMVYALQHSFLIRDEQGKPSHLASVITDITERKEAEEALRASEERFRGYFEQGLIGMAVASLDKRWLEVNDRLCEILGYSRQELVGMRWTEATHPDDLQANLVPFNRLLAGDIDHFTFDKRFIRKDGGIVFTTIFIRRFRRNDGSADHILALIEDVTQRKRAEEALRQSEERYRTVVEDQTEIISRFKADGTFTFVNEVFCRFFGKTSQELLGSKWEPIVVPEDTPMVKKQLRGMSADNPVVVIENRVYSSEGEVRWMQFVNRGFFGQEGRLMEIQSVGRDVTTRREAEEALRKERQALKHMLRASDHERQVIAYDIHDGLAQQIAGALMQFEVFDHQKESKPKKAADAFQAGMTMLRQSHFEARRLINGVRPPILDESGVAAAIAHLVHEPRGRNAPEIEFHSKARFDRLASVEENSIYRIVQEGVSNACKHSKSKKVRVNLVQRDDQIRIEIRDWGVGFDPKTVPEKQFGLTGIRERARLLGGKCRIRSKPKEGTVIAVELPVMARQTEE